MGGLASIRIEKGKTDLHIHTCYSDGACTPEEIVLRYQKAGFETIAITDHDTTDGISEAVTAGLACGLTVIPGIEISTVSEKGVETHILGYGFDRTNDLLCRILEQLREARHRRNERLIGCLKKQGYVLTYEELLIGKRGGYVGKPDFGRAMARRGYIRTPGEIFTPGKYLETKEAKAIKKEKLDTRRAIQLIAEAGGEAVLAHPIQIKEFGVPGSREYFDRLVPFLESLQTCGLKGLEVYHPDQNEEQSACFRKIAEDLGLLMTRGSDFHGDDFKRGKK
mgnify:CR=1 FL=1